MMIVLSGYTSDALLPRVQSVVKSEIVVHPRPGACRLAVDSPLTEPAKAAIIAICESEAVDVAFLDAAGVRFSQIKLLAMDMDSTLIDIECIDEIAALLGKGAEVARITEATMQGRIANFADSLNHRVALLAGADESILREVFESRLHLTPGARELLTKASGQGIHTLLLSGGFTYFSDRLRDELGIDEAFANELEIIGGKLSGRVSGSIVDGVAKAAYVRSAMQRIGCTAATSMVIGDGANDIPMMREVDHSIAYHAKKPVIDAARHSIKFGTLQTVIDYFE